MGRLQDGTIHRQGDGFTFLEVLISITILSVIIAALYSSYFLSQKAVDSVDESLLRMQEARAVVDTIKREMESSLYGQERPDTLFQMLDRDFFGAQASRITFTAFTPFTPGLARIEYFVEELDGRLMLKKRMSPASGAPPEERDFEMIGDIASFTIEANYNGTWVKTWDAALTRKAPEELRIAVTVLLRQQEDRSPDRPAASVLTITDVAKPKIGRSL